MENIKDMELTNKEDILKRLGCPNAEVTAEELESLSKSDLVGIVLKETQNGFRWLPKEIDTEVYDLKGQIEKALVDAYRVIELEKLQKEEEKRIANETKYDGLSAAEYFEVLSKDEFGGAIEIMKISPDMEVIEREQEIKELTYVSNRENPTALILGPAGLGKTALVSGWKLRQDQIDKLHVQIISLHMNLLENEGDMAQRLIRLIPALKKYEDKLKEEDEKARVVLFIDEVHTVITSFDNKGVKTKLGADVLKTITTKAPIMLIGATTENEYNQYIAPDEAFVRRFRLIRLTSISKLATRAALRNKLIKRLGYDFSHNVGDNVLNYIIDLGHRYRTHLAEPAKSLDILDTIIAISETDDVVINKELVDKAFQSLNIIPDRKDDVRKIMAVIEKRIKGQHLAILKIKNAVVNMVYPTTTSNRPRITGLMPGSTGVGKTAMVKAFAEAMTGDAENFIPFKMQNYTGELGLERFRSKLGKEVDRNPEAIILLDELEKAAENQTSIMDPLDEGETTFFRRSHDGGEDIEKVVSLKGTMIFATTNAGSDIFKSMGEFSIKETKGMSDEQLLQLWDDTEEQVKTALKNAGFKPEVYGRFKTIIPFYALTLATKVEIAEMMLQARVKIFREEFGIEIEFPEAPSWDLLYKDVGKANTIAMYFAVEKQSGKTSDSGGARDIERSIEEFFDSAIKNEMIKEENSQITRYVVKTNGKTNLEQDLAYALADKYGTAQKLESQGKDSRGGKLLVIPHTIAS